MAKAKMVFFCKECGSESAKWLGQCPGCRAWDTMVEEPSVKKSAYKASGVSKRSEPVKLEAVSTEGEERRITGIGEFDRVLGGGIVKGSLVLVGGDPGIGKSTLLLQVCRKLSLDGVKLLYISGEESLHQIKMKIRSI